MILVVYGNNTCHQVASTRRILGALKVSYQYVDINDSEEGKKIVSHINNGNLSVPLIQFPSGDVLVEPTPTALTRKLRDEHLIR